MNIEYVAGFFDGEGSVSIFIYSKKYHRLCVSVAQRGEHWLEPFREIWGGQVTSKGSGKNRKRECHQWQVVMNDAEKFLQDVLPYLKVKKAQAVLALEFRNKCRNISRGKITPEMFDLRESNARTAWAILSL